MKKLSYFLIIVGLLFAGYYFFQQVIAKEQGVQQITSLVRPTHVVPTPTVTPIPATIPIRLQIPKIQVDAAVESVGLDSEGRMGVPEKAADVAWYNKGYRIGEAGNAVMAGHLDNVTGAPAVFWYLAKLQPGDPVYVVGSNGKTYTYTVTKVTSYPYNNFPLEEVFGTADSSQLNLITCAGTWNKSSHNYSERTVVYTTLTK